MVLSMDMPSRDCNSLARKAQEGVFFIDRNDDVVVSGDNVADSIRERDTNTSVHHLGDR